MAMVSKPELTSHVSKRIDISLFLQDVIIPQVIYCQ